MNDAVKVSGSEIETRRRSGGFGFLKSYALSFCWIAFAFALAASSTISMNVVFSDAVQGNSNRSLSESILTISFMAPTLGFVAIVGCFLVFSLPQALQAVLHMLARRFARPFSQLAVLTFVPLLAVLTWYCWEYLTPTDFAGGDDPDWKPYQHGITVQRYLAALAYQVPISIFSIVYVEPSLLGTSRKTIVLVAIACAILAGAWYGHQTAVVGHATS